jgi:hypothetical protein
MAGLGYRLSFCVALFLVAAPLSCVAITPSHGQTSDFFTFEELVPGLLSRKRYECNEEDLLITVLDLLVGPQKASDRYNLTEAEGLFDVQGGEAILSINGKPRWVRPGNIIKLARNQTISIDNTRSFRPLVVRLILISEVGAQAIKCTHN